MLRLAPRLPVITAALVVLSAGLASAQGTDSLPGYGLQDGPIFNYGLFPDYEQTRSAAQVERDLEIERKYRETVKAKIPDRNSKSDPWKNLRSAPAAAAVPYDRHRPI
jgi:hypothetical protein